jgi:hypothetical protein
MIDSIRNKCLQNATGKSKYVDLDESNIKTVHRGMA